MSATSVAGLRALPDSLLELVGTNASYVLADAAKHAAVRTERLKRWDLRYAEHRRKVEQERREQEEATQRQQEIDRQDKIDAIIIVNQCFASRDRITSLVDAHQDWTNTTISEIACHQVRIGMTPEQALAAWGRPYDVNRTITASMIREQWVYDGSYLYFEDGFLTAIQN